MKYRAFLYLVVMTCFNTHAAKWIWLANSPSGGMAYVLADGGTDLFPVIWFKTTNAKGHTLSISKDVIDCRKGKYAVKEVSQYNDYGKVSENESFLFHHWNQIIPDSMAQYEYKFSCHHDLFK